MRKALLCAAVLVQTACQSSKQYIAVTEKIAADSSRSTEAGTAFTVPAGWSLNQRQSLTVLDLPEPDGHIALVDLKAADAPGAVAAAWAAYRPEMKRPLRITSPSPARDGWDERRRFEYETSPNERTNVQA